MRLYPEKKHVCQFYIQISPEMAGTSVRFFPQQKVWRVGVGVFGPSCYYDWIPGTLFEALWAEVAVKSTCLHSPSMGVLLSVGCGWLFGAGVESCNWWLYFLGRVKIGSVGWQATGLEDSRIHLKVPTYVIQQQTMDPSHISLQWSLDNLNEDSEVKHTDAHYKRMYNIYLYYIILYHIISYYIILCYYIIS